MCRWIAICILQKSKQASGVFTYASIINENAYEFYIGSEYVRAKAHTTFSQKLPVLRNVHHAGFMTRPFVEHAAYKNVD